MNQDINICMRSIICNSTVLGWLGVLPFLLAGVGVLLGYEKIGLPVFIGYSAVILSFFGWHSLGTGACRATAQTGFPVFGYPKFAGLVMPTVESRSGTCRFDSRVCRHCLCRSVLPTAAGTQILYQAASEIKCRRNNSTFCSFMVALVQKLSLNHCCLAPRPRQ